MNKEIETNEMLAVIQSDLKKLVKHFRLDRRRQGDEGVDNESESENETLQTIAVAVKEISERKLFTEEQIASLNKIITGTGKYFHYGNDERHTELKSLLEIIVQKLNEQPTEPQVFTTHHKHYFTIDFKNSKAALTMTAMGFVILISLGFNVHQVIRNNALRDNDIKYRYVKMQGKASPDELDRLESIFTFDRNKDSIRILRRRVEQYEQLVKEQAEKIERARLNADEAEKLKDRVKSLKEK